jgi:glycine oxidase
MTKSVGIVGAGLIGRLLALELASSGYQVSLFDRDERLGAKSCGWTGAGMLSPYSELESAEPVIFDLGIASLELWPSIIRRLPKPVFFQRAGSLIVAHGRDRADLMRFKQRVESNLPASHSQGSMRWLCAEKIAEIEPDLGMRFHGGVFLEDEGQIDNRQLFGALDEALRQLEIPWSTGVEVKGVKPHRLNFNEAGVERELSFDCVIDSRGLGGRSDWQELRGVRGELITIFAPDLHLNRPIRLMHPRYPLYVVPREDQRFLVGATTIESEDQSPLTVQSALELLSAAFSLHPGFAHAAIEETRINCRPALLDNNPRILFEPGLIRVNGLYRHGFLVSPKLVNLVAGLLSDEVPDLEFESLFAEEKLLGASPR